MYRPYWLLMLVVVPMTLHAQIGAGSSCCNRVTARVQAGQMTLHDDNGGGAPRHEWLQAIVLWRTRNDWDGSYSSTGASEFAFRVDSARVASRTRGRQYLGGATANGYHYVEYDQQHLWALNQEFILPHRDSALVVMIDGVDAPGGPRVAGHAYIAAEMPEQYWTKMWTSGDTTFMIHPRNVDGLLLEALHASPDVRAFIETPPSQQGPIARPRPHER